jgi:hypothetical protein
VGGRNGRITARTENPWKGKLLSASSTFEDSGSAGDADSLVERDLGVTPETVDN